MRHPHADLIHDWAEGAEIEVFTILGDEWVVTDAPTWDERLTYRIKHEPKWYENIPPHGVLCWVHDELHNTPIISSVKIYASASPRPYGCDGWMWKYATPLTNDEIRQFLRGEK